MKRTAFATALLLLSGSAFAGYVYDSAGTHVRDSAGNCVVDGQGAPDIVPVECGGPGEEVVVVEEGIARVATVDVYDRVVHFAFDSSELDQEALTRLAIFVETQISEDATVVVTGHTDAVGTDEYNDALGLARASTVANVLVEMGVNVIDVTSLGEQDLLVDTQRATRENRRVQVDVLR